MTRLVLSESEDAVTTRVGFRFATVLKRLIWLCLSPLRLLAAWRVADIVLTIRTRRDWRD